MCPVLVMDVAGMLCSVTRVSRMLEKSASILEP
jgi:hypothetical protein